MFTQARRLLRHLWLDESDSRRAIPPALLARLTERVAASELRHSGEIRIYIEAGLPTADLWRQWRRGTPPRQAARERAVTLFSLLRVWDTAQNNGVLIYLLLADHAIEIVADRGLSERVPADTWQVLVRHMGDAFRAGHFEEGLTDALAEVSALLVAHFPSHAAAADAGNELPDEPLLG